MTNFELDTTIDELLSNNLLSIKKNKKSITVIDPFELTKNIKQLALLLQTLNVEKKNIKINFLVSSKFIKTSIQQFLAKSDFKKLMYISQNITEIKSGDVVIICGDFGVKELDYIINRLFKENRYVFNIINDNQNIYNKRNGSYILYNESNDLKKIFYLVTLINKLL